MVCKRITDVAHTIDAILVSKKTSKFLQIKQQVEQTKCITHLSLLFKEHSQMKRGGFKTHPRRPNVETTPRVFLNRKRLFLDVARSECLSSKLHLPDVPRVQHTMAYRSAIPGSVILALPVTSAPRSSLLCPVVHWWNTSTVCCHRPKLCKSNLRHACSKVSFWDSRLVGIASCGLSLVVVHRRTWVKPPRDCPSPRRFDCAPFLFFHLPRDISPLMSVKPNDRQYTGLWKGSAGGSLTQSLWSICELRRSLRLS